MATKMSNEKALKSLQEAFPEVELRTLRGMLFVADFDPDKAAFMVMNEVSAKSAVAKSHRRAAEASPPSPSLPTGAASSAPAVPVSSPSPAASLMDAPMAVPAVGSSSPASTSATADSFIFDSSAVYPKANARGVVLELNAAQAPPPAAPPQASGPAAASVLASLLQPVPATAATTEDTPGAPPLSAVAPSGPAPGASVQAGTPLGSRGASVPAVAAEAGEEGQGLVASPANASLTLSPDALGDAPCSMRPEADGDPAQFTEGVFTPGIPLSKVVAAVSAANSHASFSDTEEDASARVVDSTPNVETDSYLSQIPSAPGDAPPCHGAPHHAANRVGAPAGSGAAAGSPPPADAPAAPEAVAAAELAVGAPETTPAALGHLPAQAEKTGAEADSADGAAAEFPAGCEAAGLGGTTLSEEARETVDEKDKQEEEAAEDPLSWSRSSISLLGSQMCASTFSRDAIDSVLAQSSSIKVELQEGIQGVEELQARAAEAEARAERAEWALEAERAREQQQQETAAFVLQGANNDLDMLEVDVAAEQAVLQQEARELLKYLTDLHSNKEVLAKELEELRAALESRVEAAEARIGAAEVEMKRLMASRRTREQAEQGTVDSIAQRKAVLEKEKAACAELKAFLAEKSMQVDAVKGSIEMCAERIQSLRHSILARPAVPEVEQSGVPPAGTPKAASLRSCTVSSLHGSAPDAFPARLVGSGAGTRNEMKEVLQTMLSSSEGSSAASAAASSSCSSPMLGASAEDLRQRAMQALSFVQGIHGSSVHAASELGYSSALASSVASSAAAAAALGLVEDSAPVVRVSEEDAEATTGTLGSGNTPAVPSSHGSSGEAQPGSPDREEDWENVSYPPDV